MKLGTLILGLSLVGGLATIVAVQRTLGATSIQGRILDPFGIPVPKARVEVTILDRTPLQTFTDEQGYYRINDVPIGTVTVVAISLGFMLEKATVEVRQSGELQLDFGLAAGYGHDPIPIEVSGIVRQKDASPLEDATVTVANAFNKRLTTSVQTDKNGSYTVQIRYPGQYLVHASKPGFIVSATAVVLPAKLPRKPQKVDLTLMTPTTGSIYEASGK
jgi:hypothetical protein